MARPMQSAEDWLTPNVASKTSATNAPTPMHSSTIWVIRAEPMASSVSRSPDMTCSTSSSCSGRADTVWTHAWSTVDPEAVMAAVMIAANPSVTSASSTVVVVVAGPAVVVGEGGRHQLVVLVVGGSAHEPPPTGGEEQQGDDDPDDGGHRRLVAVGSPDRAREPPIGATPGGEGAPGGGGSVAPVASAPQILQRSHSGCTNALQLGQVFMFMAAVLPVAVWSHPPVACGHIVIRPCPPRRTAASKGEP